MTVDLSHGKLSLPSYGPPGRYLPVPGALGDIQRASWLVRHHVESVRSVRCTRAEEAEAK